MIILELAVVQSEFLGWERALARQVRTEYDITRDGRTDVIRVRFVREAKTVVDFVVQLEAYIDGNYRQVVRYDGSHGRPHRDVLDWEGRTIEKRWAQPGTTNSRALTDAVSDVISNSDRYITEFLQRRP